MNDWAHVAQELEQLAEDRLGPRSARIVTRIRSAKATRESLESAVADIAQTSVLFVDVSEMEALAKAMHALLARTTNPPAPGIPAPPIPYSPETFMDKGAVRRVIHPPAGAYVIYAVFGLCLTPLVGAWAGRSFALAAGLPTPWLVLIGAATAAALVVVLTVLMWRGNRIVVYERMLEIHRFASRFPIAVPVSAIRAVVPRRGARLLYHATRGMAGEGKVLLVGAGDRIIHAFSVDDLNDVKGRRLAEALGVRFGTTNEDL